MGSPLTLPQVASKVSAFKREATVTVKPPVIQIREGWYTGADVRISSSLMSKVEVTAKIPLDERAGNICKMCAAGGALLGFAVALLIYFSAVDEVRSVGLTARGEMKVARGSVFLLIGGLMIGGFVAGAGAAVVTTFLGPSPQVKEKNRKWAKDLEEHLNKTL